MIISKSLAVRGIATWYTFQLLKDFSLFLSCSTGAALAGLPCVQRLKHSFECMEICSTAREDPWRRKCTYLHFCLITYGGVSVVTVHILLFDTTDNHHQTVLLYKLPTCMFVVPIGSQSLIPPVLFLQD